MRASARGGRSKSGDDNVSRMRWGVTTLSLAALPRRSEVIGQYAALSGRPLDSWPWFEAFGWWKMGCIVEGVHARRSKGQGAGAPSGTLEAIAARADGFLHLADQKAQALGI